MKRKPTGITLAVSALIILAGGMAIAEGQASQSRWKINTETVVDTQTGLMWQRKAPRVTLFWEQTQRYCEGLKLAGFSDWRMPTAKEQKSLVQGCKTDKTCKPGKGPGENGCYWQPAIWSGGCTRYWNSDSTGDKGFGYALDFRDGSMKKYFKDGNVVGPYVRCVRGPVTK
ncbi:MAG: DUF1566 domain-containing protein [Deltaproteobacteria bacterium]|nr:DUF1566 domain-containing protein [Deltaproteobacteria bacterium]